MKHLLLLTLIASNISGCSNNPATSEVDDVLAATATPLLIMQSRNIIHMIQSFLQKVFCFMMVNCLKAQARQMIYLKQNQ